MTTTNKVCSFTGHRQIPLSELPLIKKRLYDTVLELCERGVGEFIAGGALGFDTMAEEAVLEAKKFFPNITLRLILPCRNQSLYWNEHQIAKYERIISLADSVEYISDGYTPSCMMQRNRRMIDSSSISVAYYNGRKKGGTYATVAYAEKRGLEIINIYKGM